MTSRRFFIGPIPEGWLQNHRKSWYKAGIRLKNYSSKTVSFSADPVVVHYADNSLEDEPSSSAPRQENSQDGNGGNVQENEETPGENDEEDSEEETEREIVQPSGSSGRRPSKPQTTPSTETGTSLPDVEWTRDNLLMN